MPSESRRGIKPRNRRLGMETLEARECMAIDTIVEGVTLTISGSTKADTILVRDDGHGTIHVQDGKTGEHKQFSSTISEIVVFPGEGNNVIRFSRNGGDSVMPGFLVATGAGNNDIAINANVPAAQTAARLTIQTGAGKDRLQVNTNGFSSVDLEASMGGGNDNVLIGLLLPATQIVSDSEAVAAMEIDLGKGDDRLVVNTNSLSDVNLNLLAGDGNDTVVIGLLLPAVQKDRAARATMNLDLGAGRDVLTVNTTGISDVELDVAGGAGNDTVNVGLLLPAVQASQDSAARVNIDLGTGKNISKVKINGFNTVERA